MNIKKLVIASFLVGMGFVVSIAQDTTNNTNTNNLTNTNDNSHYVKDISIENPAAGATGGMIIGSPSAYAYDKYYNSPWNFTPPQVLFHPTKTINDHSVFHKCRMIELSANIRDSLKDKLFGIFDEKEFISSGVGRLKGKSPVKSGQVITCGMNTNLPPSCVKFVGTGYVYMEDYVSTEAAMVGIARIAASKGANLIGNMNCAYQGNIQSASTGAGIGLGGVDGDDVGSLGLSAGTSKAKRTVQPHCNGDFYIVTGNCKKSEDPYMPAPRPYRRYLPNK